jgi:large subunit ribosomal protein L7/L12
MKQRLWSSDIAALGDRIAALTAAEAAELGRYLEAVHGVRAAPSPAIVRDGEPERVVDEGRNAPTEFDVVLDEFDAARRVAVIRAVREATGLGLREARDLVDACPKVIQHRLTRERAERLQGELRAAGAKASVRVP